MSAKSFILGATSTVFLFGGIGMISMAKQAPAKVETVKPVYHAKPKAKHHAKHKRAYRQPSMAEIESRVTTIEERINKAKIAVDIAHEAGQY